MDGGRVVQPIAVLRLTMSRENEYLASCEVSGKLSP